MEGSPRTNSTSASPNPRTASGRPGPRLDPQAPLPRLRETVDLAVAVALVAVAAFARLLPEENVMRLVLTLPVLLFVPGYLLIQMFAAVPRDARDRTVQALVAFGASLPVIGLLALSTAIVPGGFGPTAIVVVTTGACIVFAVVAYLRRWLLPAQGPAPAA